MKKLYSFLVFSMLLASSFIYAPIIKKTTITTTTPTGPLTANNQSSNPIRLMCKSSTDVLTELSVSPSEVKELDRNACYQISVYGSTMSIRSILLKDSNGVDILYRSMPYGFSVRNDLNGYDKPAIVQPY